MVTPRSVEAAPGAEQGVRRDDDENMHALLDVWSREEAGIERSTLGAATPRLALESSEEFAAARNGKIIGG